MLNSEVALPILTDTNGTCHWTSQPSHFLYEYVSNSAFANRPTPDALLPSGCAFGSACAPRAAMRRQRIASVCASNLQRRSAHRRVIFSERTHSIVVLASTLFFSSLFTHTRNDLLHHRHSPTTTRRMIKITAAILAAGVGSTEAWGFSTSYPTRYPTAFPTRKPTSPPVGTAHVDSKSLKTHGYNAHLLGGVQKHGFGMCQGDCDSDAQCRGSMVCYHSHKSGNTITGCEGKTLDIHDYCYEPNTLSSPARCQEWSCADWCKYFDQATEDAGVYAKNGCADDGADTCKCRN